MNNQFSIIGLYRGDADLGLIVIKHHPVHQGDELPFYVDLKAGVFYPYRGTRLTHLPKEQTTLTIDESNLSNEDWILDILNPDKWFNWPLRELNP